ncbi:MULTISPECIES: HD domain-containing protein [Pelosinus]|jgi:metal-dependent HD superfamily phosphatase/phosphodiesterase|uniref:Metal dependent phosphohydrolase n=2 Tax=Pelosinus TaxID=365348 RepID=I9NXW7_9FIRM|nr:MULTISPECIES: HD domain-containing protein [Pelosinus]AJQ27830.1 metal dependent phosphohydrolase [Pelosinus fermentans JBW45]MCC5467688.1 HD domain-containing protein [Pelosinus baikalensis]
MSKITVEDLKKDHEISVYLACSTEYLGRLGFTEHGKRHASIISDRAYHVLEDLGYEERECQLAAVAGYIHDIGNMINRYNHGGTGAVMAYNVVSRLGMPPEEIALVISAIGNHEEERGNAINPVAAALILADKSDVHRSRVTNKDFATFEIHDRVNYAANSSKLVVDKHLRRIALEIVIDTNICPVMEYFEIFLARMIMCRRAADFLNCQFSLVINNNQLL